MSTAISTSDYLLGRGLLETRTSFQVYEPSLERKDSLNRLSSYIADIWEARNYHSGTELPYLPFRRPRTDDIDLDRVKNNIIRVAFSQTLYADELSYANGLKNTVAKEIVAEGLDKGVRLLLRNLKESLLNKEYAKCNAFLDILVDSIPEFDLRLHICVLTITSHWKTFLSARSGYFFSIEEFVKNNFQETKANQILCGLE